MLTFQRFLKTALSVTACTFIGNAAHAQLSLGLKGGLNFSTVSVRADDNVNFNSRTAPNFAVLFNYQLGPMFSIQAEPGFSARGATVRGEQVVELAPGVPIRTVNKGTLKLNYFELPVVAQYRPHLTEKLEAIISAGPEIRFRTGPQKLETTSTIYMNGQKGETITNTESYSGDDAVRVFDFGLAAGAGVAYPIGRFKVFVEGRYHLGLRNLATDSEDDIKVRNRGASVVLGVTVPIVK